MDTSQILPNLFVGSCPSGHDDINWLKREGVTALLNVQTDEDMAYWGFLAHDQAGIEVRRVPIRDFDPDDLRRKLPLAVEVLEELLQEHTVYVHCNMGINRSPSVVIAYLYWVLGWDLERAADHVLKCRSCDPYLDVIRLARMDQGP